MDAPFPQPSQTAGPLVVIAAIANLLIYVGQTPSVVGEEGRSYTIAPPRFVWIPENDEIERPLMGNNNPASMADCWSGWTVEISGRSYNEAWQMRSALLAALRATTGNWYRFPATRWVKHSPTESGYVGIQSLSFNVPVPFPILPGSGGTVVDNVTPVGRAGVLNIPKPIGH